MNLFILLAVSCLFSSFNNCILHKVGDKRLSIHSTWFFNAISCAISLGMLFLLNGRISSVQRSTVFLGIAYGIVTAMFSISKMMSLSYGSISITTMLGNCSLIIPTLFGIAYYKEKASVYQLLGFIFILLSLVLCSNFSRGRQKFHKKWILWCSAFFISAGLISILFKIHQMSFGKNEINEMMIIAFTVSTVLLLIASLCNKNFPGTVHRVLNKDVLWFVVLCAVSSTIYNRLNIYLSGVMPSVVFFPIFNGSVILLTTVSGVFLYKEKLSVMQMFGIVLGTVSIILIGVF